MSDSTMLVVNPAPAPDTPPQPGTILVVDPAPAPDTPPQPGTISVWVHEERPVDPNAPQSEQVETIPEYFTRMVGLIDGLTPAQVTAALRLAAVGARDSAPREIVYADRMHQDLFEQLQEVFGIVAMAVDQKQ